MKLCSKCNEIMKPIGDHTFECISCKNQESGKDLVESEKVVHKKEAAEGVVEDKNIFANYPFTCEKCGYDKAEVVERQPYVSDEDSLTYLKCGKCGWMENLARKTS